MKCKELIKMALSLREAGRCKEAAALLETASVGDGTETERFRVYFFLGSLYWQQLGQLGRALDALRHAVRMKPALALASLALFNCLLDADDSEGALKEGERFFEGRWEDPPGSFLAERSDTRDLELVSDYRLEVADLRVLLREEK